MFNCYEVYMYQRIFNKKRRNTWSKNIISIWLAWKNWIFPDSYRNSPFLLKCPLQEKKLWFSWHGNHVTYSYLSFDYKLPALPLLIGLVANYIGSIFSKSLQSVFPLFVGYVCTVVAVFCCCLCTCLWSLKPLLFFVLTELALPRCCLCPVVSKGFWWKFSQQGFPAAWLIQRCCACWHFIRNYSWFVIHRQKNIVSKTINQIDTSARNVYDLLCCMETKCSVTSTVRRQDGHQEIHS